MNIEGFPELAEALGDRLDITVTDIRGWIRWNLNRDLTAEQEGDIRKKLAWAIAMAAAAGVAHGQKPRSKR